MEVCASPKVGVLVMLFEPIALRIVKAQADSSLYWQLMILVSFLYEATHLSVWFLLSKSFACTTVAKTVVNCSFFILVIVFF